MMRSLFIIAIAIFAVSACRSTGTSRIANPVAVEKKISSMPMQNKDEIVAVYGKPNNVFTKDGNDVYEYKYIKVKNSILGYVPILGMWFDRTYTLSYLYVYFDKSGNMTNFDTVNVQGDYPV